MKASIVAERKEEWPAEIARYQSEVSEWEQREYFELF